MGLTPSYGPFIAGTDFTIDFSVVDEDGDIVDLTGATIVARVEVLFITNKSISIVDASLGTCRMIVTAAQNVVAHGTYDGELQITIAGVVRKGKLRLRIEDTLF